MNKKLIVSAMGLVAAGGMGLANADVKLYGQIDLSLLYTDSGAQGYESDTNMESTNSNFGIKGEEDLGNGMNAFFKIEYEYDVAESSGLSGRDQYVGLGFEKIGKFTAGTTSTAYKDVSKQIDPFYMTQLQSRAIGLQSNLHSGKGEEGQGRGTNIVRYDSPSWAGFGLVATYQFDSDKQNQVPNCNAVESCEDDDPYSVGATYKAGNLYANAAYITTQRSDDNAAAEFAVRYDWNDFSFHGIYEYDDGLITAQRDNGLDGGTGGRSGFAQDTGADIWSVGATYTIGNNLIALDGGHGDSSDGKDGIANTADDLEEYDVYRIGAWHSFSKRTRVYAGYGYTDYNDKGSDDRVALGIRHNF
jgi:predicted porin